MINCCLLIKSCRCKDEFFAKNKKKDLLIQNSCFHCKKNCFYDEQGKKEKKCVRNYAFLLIFLFFSDKLEILLFSENMIQCKRRRISYGFE